MLELETNNVVLIGYSSHALVVAETLMQANFNIVGYFDKNEVKENLLGIPYMGSEHNIVDLDRIRGMLVFPAIGDNLQRAKVILLMKDKGFNMPIAVSPKAHVSQYSTIKEGSLICQGACINPFAIIGRGVIINTASIVEHECNLEDFSHIAPGAVLTGNVKVGKGSFIGANSVIHQGVKIGANVIIGAGSVVLKNVPDNTIMVGNPAKNISK